MENEKKTMPTENETVSESAERAAVESAQEDAKNIVKDIDLTLLHDAGEVMHLGAEAILTVYNSLKVGQAKMYAFQAREHVKQANNICASLAEILPTLTTEDFEDLPSDGNAQGADNDITLESFADTVSSITDIVVSLNETANNAYQECKSVTARAYLYQVVMLARLAQQTLARVPLTVMVDNVQKAAEAAK